MTTGELPYYLHSSDYLLCQQLVQFETYFGIGQDKNTKGTD